MTERPTFPVVDVFAGPGGLSEGLSEFRQAGYNPFRVALSIEKDPVACRTLKLRKFLREFRTAPDEYQALLKGEVGLDGLYAAFPREAALADLQTWHAELGVEREATVTRRVRAALGNDGVPWVLVGGPPCQAYSIAGRSRMKSTRPDFEKDDRHFLYREYLQIVAKHRPAVFVMENVRGILSSTHGGTGIFRRILNDLRRPAVAADLPAHRRLEYHLYGLAAGALGPFQDGSDPVEYFLLKAEDYGVPQSRHRVFVVGVRSDLDGTPVPLEPATTGVDVADVLDDMPPLRSRLSRTADSWPAWLDALRSVRGSSWMQAGADSPYGPVAREVRRAIGSLVEELPVGGAYVDHRRTTVGCRSLSDWYRRDTRGLTLHESRAHMKEDLHRYLFAACYALVNRRSASLRDLPAELRPRHRNVHQAIEGEMFGDRFHVQQRDQPSSTITSHLAKDGHYFIHYAPQQCRSITVREAARLQTFPDNYFFCGNRTEQYQQVGNAVPPLLALQVARSIYPVLRAALGGRA